MLSRIKKEINNYISYYRDGSTSLEKKSILLFTQCTIPTIIIFTLFFHVIDSGSVLRQMMFGALCFHIGIAYILYRYDNVHAIKYIIAINTNFLFFPTCFIITGDINNGGALFFPIGIIITFFLIKEKIVYLITTLELAWYVFIIMRPCFHYDEFAVYRESQPLGVGIIVCFGITAVISIIILSYQAMLYNRSHQQFEEAEKVIELAKDNKSRFLANMTHEIRTPMNSIVGMNELIMREELAPEIKELAEGISKSSTQLLSTINNILEYSKLDSKRMNLYLQKYDLGKLITEIINAVSSEYAIDNNELFVRIDPNIPSILFGDSIRIKQVFMYVLFSTIHKIRNNRVILKINGEIDRSTNTCLLTCTISETALGLSKEQIDAMMSAFTQFDSRQKNDFQGMGLELSICNEILKLMGGSLRIDSVEDVGMAITFEFINYIIDEFPIAKVSNPNTRNVLVYCKDYGTRMSWERILGSFDVTPEFVSGPNAFRNEIENRTFSHIFIDDVFYEILKDTIRAAGISDNTYILGESGSVYTDFENAKVIRKPLTCINVSTALNNMWVANDYKITTKKEMVTYPAAKVLIVDDSLVNLKVLEGILSTFKINVSKAKSGEEALSILREEEFDLLIYDQQMPGMDGTELLHLTKELDNANAKVPVLCATADFGTEVAKNLIAVGFKDYLAKPIRKHYLERMLREYISPELAVNIVVDVDDETDTKGKSKPKEKIEKEEKITSDPLVIDFNKGLNNIAGNMDAFGAVVLAYYKEGINKLNTVPDLLENDLPLYIIDVHALKSSSAAIGAEGISDMFKSLEFAGRADNKEFLVAHTRDIFDKFEKVLEIVKDYLVKNNLYVEEDNTPAGEEVTLDVQVIRDILDAYSKFNLKLCEDKLNELCGINYGVEINAKIKAANDALNQFDYHKMKDELTTLEESLN